MFLEVVQNVFPFYELDNKVISYIYLIVDVPIKMQGVVYSDSL